VITIAPVLTMLSSFDSKLRPCAVWSWPILQRRRIYSARIGGCLEAFQQTLWQLCETHRRAEAFTH
jgi:hypothetical protein